MRPSKRSISRFAIIAKLFILLLLASNFSPVSAQTNDTLIQDTSKIKLHSPKKAALMSALLPGLGQIYNRKYWKLPIIYGGLGTCGYIIVSNRGMFVRFRDAYRLRMDEDPLTIDEFASPDLNPEGAELTDDNLRYSRDKVRRQLEFFTVISAAIYLMNVVDASVDAHLFDFDMGDDLSLHIQPVLLHLQRNRSGTPGVSVCLRFK
ncbi:MAG: hypothetical protein KKA07_16415 [Bacteroidetes bacterium]|nr:hypothetical protein [Bacteroidota bacterium]MBU1720650.1 hypothetical protein [Bacteroidota bacterium]